MQLILIHMSKMASTLAFLLACFQYAASAAPTWPAGIDELEDLMFLNSGYRSRPFAAQVTPCSKEFSPGRVTAAAWLRTAFHDFAPADVFFKTGGLDASLQYELARGENNGQAFPASLGMWAPFLSPQTSLSDVIAAAVYAAVRSCGGPVVPVRGGHIDAKKAGSLGAPLPQNPIGTFRNQFVRMGFNNTAMIQFVACGHTLGDVHASDNPDIVSPNTFPNDAAPLDTTPSTFDTRIATEYVSSVTQNPLVVGRSIQSKKNSDFVVFNSDNNKTIAALQDAQTFSSICLSLFQQMIETVPSGVTLSDIVTPYDVKPYDLQLTLLDGGEKVRFTGDIRIRTTKIKNVALVQLLYKDSTGSAVSTPIDTFLSGSSSGFDDTFMFLGFSTDLPTDKSISTFDVRIVTTDGTPQTFGNNGNGFSVNSGALYQAQQSCSSGTGKFTVVAAARKQDGPAPVLEVVQRVPQASPNPVPSQSTTNIPMATQSASGAYQLYSADYTAPPSSSLASVLFRVSAGDSALTYQNASSLATACKRSPPMPSSSPAYAFWGCYSDSFDPRSLSVLIRGDSSVTLDSCASLCSSSGYAFYGVEYGSDCWCGNELNSASTIQPISDCNMPCAGDANKFCGAAFRLSLYGPSPPNSGPPSSTRSSSSKRSSSATSSASPTPTPTSVPSLPDYDYVGCLSDAVDNRTLHDRFQSTPTNNYTTCASFCTGYEFFGVEYASECYCGINLKYAIEQPLASCSHPCTGAPSDYCGGSALIMVFKNKNPVRKPRNPPIPGYRYKGCYVDNVNVRTLSEHIYFNAALTVEKCAAQCAAYNFFGTEYGGECYCGSTLPANATEAAATDCRFLCGGDEAELCGAGDRLSLYEKN